ncbi:MAG TPA: heme peroxidase, partial [Hyphomonas sp.]|nr:heme peroxidase [Hyphomonas sp.]
AYRINLHMTGTAAERRDNPELAGRRLIFAAAQYGGLNGFRPIPEEWGIDWRLYFEIDRKLDPARIGDGRRRVQAAYKIDTSLTNPLAFLPEFSEAGKGGDLAADPNGQPRPRPGAVSNLAARNLLRGFQIGLPSGQEVARAMGIDPIADRDLLVGKATVDGLSENRSITEYGASFRDSAPLWFYILAESQHLWAQKARAHSGTKEQRDAIPTVLGPVGAQIVAETFVALMQLDPRSILHAGPDWSPRYLRNNRFSMAELVLGAHLA